MQLPLIEQLILLLLCVPLDVQNISYGGLDQLETPLWHQISWSLVYSPRSPWCMSLPTSHLTSMSPSSSPWASTNCFRNHGAGRHSASEVFYYQPLSPAFSAFLRCWRSKLANHYRSTPSSFSRGFWMLIVPHYFKFALLPVFLNRHHVVLRAIRIPATGS